MVVKDNKTEEMVFVHLQKSGMQFTPGVGEGDDYASAVQDGKVMVPAGWANDVIDAWQNGVYQIMRIRHAHLSDADECPDGYLSCSFNGSEFESAVGLDSHGNVVTER